MMFSTLLQLWVFSSLTHAAPFRGGTITWRPVNSSATTSTVSILIHQTFSWTLSRLRCNQSTINSLGWYTDNGGPFTGEPFIQCQSAAASCTASGFTTISQRTFCTDFSILAQSSTGALITRVILARTTNIIIGYTGGTWPAQVRMTNGAVASSFRVLSRMNLSLRPDGSINTPPVVVSLPIIRVIEGQTAVVRIPIGDWDGIDEIRCRWASSTGVAGNECGDVCNNLPGAVLSASDCTITWSAVRRPIDISAGVNTSTYVIAIMVEDFYNSASVTPMSSVPLQVLISTYRPPPAACHIPPMIIGDRPNFACVGAPINVTLVERIVATVFCAGDYIVELTTTSPLSMMKTAITPVSGTSNLYYIILTWTPRDDQMAPQIFCAAPVDQHGVSGSQHCIHFIVGFSAPNLIRPSTVQGSASPIGTVFSNHSIFSIQTNYWGYRPYRNGTYIQIFERTNATLVWQVDCGYSPSCIYMGNTLLFYVPNANWTNGAHYYILFGSGVVSGNVFCAPESAPITDPTFWTFDIWNPSASSTTAATTAPPTTVTVTTRGISTTTPSITMTTTGISITPSTTITTTTSTTQTMETYSNVPTEPENKWREPMIIGIVIGSLTLLFVTILAIYLCCTRKKKPKRTSPIVTFFTSSKVFPMIASPQVDPMAAVPHAESIITSPEVDQTVVSPQVESESVSAEVAPMVTPPQLFNQMESIIEE